MGEKEREFRQKIARIGKIEYAKKLLEEDSKEVLKEDKKQNNLSEVLPAICGVKKSIENFRKDTKEIIDEER